MEMDASLSNGNVTRFKSWVAKPYMCGATQLIDLGSVFCSRIAKADETNSVDYAQALHVAKKWARDQQKWKSPYYWGTFVLVGPN